MPTTPTIVRITPRLTKAWPPWAPMWLTTPAMSVSDASGAITMTTACQPSARQTATARNVCIFRGSGNGSCIPSAGGGRWAAGQLAQKRSAELRGDDSRLGAQDQIRGSGPGKGTRRARLGRGEGGQQRLWPAVK